MGNLYFLRTALNAIRRARGEEELDAMDFLALAKEKMKLVELDPAFGSRSVNEGFSGGEKKRNEVFQMAVLEPTLAILDEIDSGLDIDALRVVSQGVNALRGAGRAIVLVTHYQRLLDYVAPDVVHVMAAGRIVRSGGRELAQELEKTGYAWAGGEGDAGGLQPAAPGAEGRAVSGRAAGPVATAAGDSLLALAPPQGEPAWLGRGAPGRAGGLPRRRPPHHPAGGLALHQPGAAGRPGLGPPARGRRRPRREGAAARAPARSTARGWSS